MTVVLYRVIKVGTEYLDTTVWGILTAKQRSAFRFTTREQAHQQARAWRGEPDYAARGVRVVRVVARS